MKENQTQPKSFRITEETANKLKEIASINKKNQQETLAMLIQAYEMQEGKEVLSGKRDDIEKFQGLMTTITRMYMAALEDGKDAMTVAKSQYEAQLNSKDQMILDLQKRVKELQDTNGLLYSEKDAYETEIQSLEEKNEETENKYAQQKDSYDVILQGKQALLEEKMKSILTLEDQVRALETKNKTLVEEKTMAQTLEENLKLKLESYQENQEKLASKIVALETIKKELEDSLDKAKDFYEKEAKKIEEHLKDKYQLELEKQVFMAKKEAEEAYSGQLKECQENLNLYRNKYYAFLEKQIQE